MRLHTRLALYLCLTATGASAVPRVAVVVVASASAEDPTRSPQPARRPASRRANRARRRRREEPALAPQDPSADRPPLGSPALARWRSYAARRECSGPDPLREAVCLSFESAARTARSALGSGPTL